MRYGNSLSFFKNIILEKGVVAEIRKDVPVSSQIVTAQIPIVNTPILEAREVPIISSPPSGINTGLLPLNSPVSTSDSVLSTGNLLETIPASVSPISLNGKIASLSSNEYGISSSTINPIGQTLHETGPVLTHNANLGHVLTGVSQISSTEAPLDISTIGSSLDTISTNRPSLHSILGPLETTDGSLTSISSAAPTITNEAFLSSSEIPPTLLQHNAGLDLQQRVASTQLPSISSTISPVNIQSSIGINSQLDIRPTVEIDNRQLKLQLAQEQNSLINNPLNTNQRALFTSINTIRPQSTPQSRIVYPGPTITPGLAPIGPNPSIQRVETDQGIGRTISETDLNNLAYNQQYTLNSGSGSGVRPTLLSTTLNVDSRNNIPREGIYQQGLLGQELTRAGVNPSDLRLTNVPLSSVSAVPVIHGTVGLGEDWIRQGRDIEENK